MAQYDIRVKAGPGGENSDVYRFVTSPIPKGITSVDDPTYAAMTKSALEAATKVVRATGKDITLNFLVELPNT